MGCHSLLIAPIRPHRIAWSHQEESSGRMRVRQVSSISKVGLRIQPRHPGVLLGVSPPGSIPFFEREPSQIFEANRNERIELAHGASHPRFSSWTSSILSSKFASARVKSRSRVTGFTMLGASRVLFPKVCERVIATHSKCATIGTVQESFRASHGVNFNSCLALVFAEADQRSPGRSTPSLRMSECAIRGVSHCLNRRVELTRQ